MSDQDKETEQSFNDAELQDIMNEIENLEKEFVEDSDEAQDADAPKSETKVEPEEEVQAAQSYEDSNIVPLKSTESTQQRSSPADDSGQLNFSGAGHMNMELSFPVGGETATVNIVEGSLVVEMAGVHLSLTEEGCEVSMAGGVKFSVPVHSKDVEKKAA